MVSKDPVNDGPEKAILVALALPDAGEWLIDRSLDELAKLAETAGAEVAERVVQSKPKPDPKTFIGRGKAREIEDLRRRLKAESVIFDNELSPSQQLNLEEIFGGKVIDRTGLILDIFAQHAHSAAGKLQVELAQLNYYLPRLKGLGIQLSRLGGGIGTRGPGETKLETDRRRIHRRVQKLNEKISTLKKNLATQRRARTRGRVFTVSLAGYTNAGKSSLLNRLTGADILIADQLFATLDSTTRRLRLPGGTPAVLSDTVGFIEKLPHQLIAAFHSTLDEMVSADLLLHVIDAADPAYEDRSAAVAKVLAQIGAVEIPRLKVYNKADLIEPDLAAKLRREPDSLLVSCATGEGLDRLIEAIDLRARAGMVEIEVVIPFTQGDLRQRLYDRGAVLHEEHGPAGHTIRVRLRRDDAQKLRSELARPGRR